MSAYSDPASVHPYWYYDPHGYQPNVSMPGNGNTSAHTPVYPSFDMYSNHSSRLADSGYLSRTPTPPTPGRVASPPRSALLQQDSESNDMDPRFSEKAPNENKPRLPYVKRTRIQYTMQQLQILEDAFQNNHYPEVTTVDALAELLDVRHEKISIWFQNRRSRFKRQQKPKSASSNNNLTKKPTQPMSLPPAVSSPPSYDPSTSYYSPYFWPSPIVDSRSMTSYQTHPHSSSFYDANANSMWNQNSTGYSSPSPWHQCSSSSMNLSVASPSSPSILSEHLPPL